MGGDHKKIDKTLSEEFTPSAFNIKPDGSNASSSAVEGGFQFTSKGKKDSSSLLLFSGHATIATTIILLPFSSIALLVIGSEPPHITSRKFVYEFSERRFEPTNAGHQTLLLRKIGEQRRRTSKAENWILHIANPQN